MWVPCALVPWSMRGGCHPSLLKKETLLSQHLGVERPQGKCHSEHRCHSRPVGSTPPPGLLLSRSRSASQCTNQHHPSLPPPQANGSPTSGLSTGAIVGILVVTFVLLLVAVDVTCYFLNKCGLLMCIAVNLCGKAGPGAKGKDMEEGKAAFS